MTNPLTQADVQAIMERMDVCHSDEFDARLYDMSIDDLVEFAQLIQERQAVNATSLVAQALEKAAGILDSRAKEWDNIPDYGCSYAGELRFNARAIRALIAKPIEPVVKDSLTAAHPPAAAVDELVEALKYAKEVIQAWHGGDAWDIYEQHSPEMKQINQALAKVKGEKLRDELEDEA